MLDKIKTDVDRLLLILIMKKKFVDIFCEIELFFSFSISKVVYLRPFLFYLPFPKFWKQNFMYFAHKHVETRTNCSHKLATFLKYHMPLRQFIQEN